MKKSWLFTFVLVGIILLQGCIYWVPEDDEQYEYVFYHNFTPFDIDCWIDDEYVGIVWAHDTLRVRDKYWEGWHMFYSEAVNGDLFWGPDEFYLSDGESLHIDLVNSMWSASPNISKAAESLNQSRENSSSQALDNKVGPQS